MGSCNLCPEQPDDADLLEHLRMMHPDQYEEPARWPDGGLAIVDETLTPADFEWDELRGESE